MSFEDGTFSSAKLVGPKRLRFPFLNATTPDKFARIIERDYVVQGTALTPTVGDRTSLTNLLTYSEQLDNAAWMKSDATVTASALANPENGQISAAAVYEAATTATHFVQQFSTVSATPYTLSGFFYALGRDHVLVQFTDAAAVSFYSAFNLSAGTASNTAPGTTATIQDAGNGWWYCAITFTPASGSGTCFLIAAQSSTVISYAGDTSKGFYAWGIQLAATSSPIAYVSTTTAARTASLPPTDYTQNGTLDSYADPFAYLVAETDPDNFAESSYQRFSRHYARLPKQQTNYGSRLLVRPSMNDLKYSTFYAVSFDSGISSWIFAARKTVSSISTPDVPNGVDGATVGVLPASATITIVGPSSTQTFAANASDSTIQTALSQANTGTNTYASSTYYPIERNIDGFTVSVDTIATTLQGLSSDSALAVVEFLGTALGQSINNAKLFSVSSPISNAASIRTINSTAHGGAAGDLVALWNGDKLWGTGRVVSTTTDAFTVQLDVVPGKDAALTHCQFAKNGLRLANEAISVTTKEVATFALPGVSVGISSPADITLATPQTAPLEWLTAICGADGSWTATATAATDYVTKTAHGLSTGDVLWIQSITSGAGGVSTMTLYYAIRVDADNFKLATSHANAIAGSGVDISSDGTGLAVLVPEQWPVIEGSNVQPWRGPMYQQTIVSAQMSDALDMLTASA